MLVLFRAAEALSSASRKGSENGAAGVTAAFRSRDEQKGPDAVTIGAKVVLRPGGNQDTKPRKRRNHTSAFAKAPRTSSGGAFERRYRKAVDMPRPTNAEK